MEQNSQKGFTLVELLAVIVILAIILIIAVPGVLTIIDNSRKDSLVSTAKTIKDAARLYITTEDSTAVNDGQTIWVPLKCLEVDVSENGYGKTINDTTSFIAITKSNNKFTYHAHLNSGSEEMTVDPTIAIEKLQRKDVDKASAFAGSLKTFDTADNTVIKRYCTALPDPDATP